MKNWLACATLVTSAAACASQPKIEPPAPLRVRVSRLFPKPDSLRASRIAVTLEIENPRASTVRVKGIDYSIDTRNVSGVLTGRVEGGAVLEAKQVAELEFVVAVPFPEEATQFYAVLDQETFPVSVKGSILFDDGGAPIAFERNGQVATPTFPRFIIHEAQAAQYGTDGLDVTLFLRLVNENPFGVTVGDVTYTVAIEGIETKSEQGALGVRLTQGAAQEFEVSTTLDESTFKNLQEILRSGLVHYAVTGRVSVGPYERPFNHEGQIVLAHDQ